MEGKKARSAQRIFVTQNHVREHFGFNAIDGKILDKDAAVC